MRLESPRERNHPGTKFNQLEEKLLNYLNISSKKGKSFRENFTFFRISFAHEVKNISQKTRKFYKNKLLKKTKFRKKKYANFS